MRIGKLSGADVIDFGTGTDGEAAVYDGVGGLRPQSSEPNVWFATPLLEKVSATNFDDQFFRVTEYGG